MAKQRLLTAGQAVALIYSFTSMANIYLRDALTTLSAATSSDLARCTNTMSNTAWEQNEEKVPYQQQREATNIWRGAVRAGGFKLGLETGIESRFSRTPMIPGVSPYKNWHNLNGEKKVKN